MNYKVGDTVVCIDATKVPGKTWDNGIKAGIAYVVDGFYPCGKVSLVGVRKHEWCGVCKDGGGAHFYTWRFIKLDGLQQETETCTDVELAENV